MKQHGDKFAITIDVTTSESNADKDFFSRVETIDQNDLPEFEELQLKDENIDLYDHDFMMLYAMDGNNSRGITTSVCVDGRAVDISLGKGIRIPDYITGTFISALLMKTAIWKRHNRSFSRNKKKYSTPRRLMTGSTKCL